MNEHTANPIADGVVRFINRLLTYVFGYVTDQNRSGIYEEKRLWFNWQNLCEDSKGNARGLPWHGRAWLYLRRKGKLQVTFRWSWNLWTHFCGASFELDGGEDGINWMLAFPPVSLWFGIEGVLSHEWMHKHYEYEAREISVKFHDWAVWWSFWRDGNGWSSKESKWRVGCFHFDNFILGKTDYNREILSEQDVDIPMPEGNYPAIVQLTEDSWSRPRWFTRRIRRADIKMVKSIPFPGKGENSWDCGEDATSSLCTTARNVEEAISAMVETVLRSRRRYGGDVMMEYPSPLT